MSEVLTLEIFESFTEQAFRFTPIKPQIDCHPLDAPFMDALLNQGKDIEKVYDLWAQCKRKYHMGIKRGIPKWGLVPLITQYKTKLATLPCLLPLK